MWSNRNSYSLIAGMQNGTATLKNNLIASYKVKHTLTRQFGNCAPWYLAKGFENLCLHKNLYMDINGDFIHSCQNWRATKMFFGR